MREAGLGVPAVVKERAHTRIFKSKMQRLGFIENLHLSVPNNLIAFCSDGSYTSIFFRVQVKEGRYQ